MKNGDEDDDGDGVKNRDDTDRNANGILDAQEGNATITSYGAASAVQVGSASRSITLGAVGTGDQAYGFINQGSITGQGVYSGVAGNAVTFGGNAGQTVQIAGGVRNEGTVTALANNAAATAVRSGPASQPPRGSWFSTPTAMLSTTRVRPRCWCLSPPMTSTSCRATRSVAATRGIAR